MDLPSSPPTIDPSPPDPRASLGARVRGVGRGTAATMLARGADVAATYGFYAVAARSLGVADFGRFVVAITMVQTVASGCRFGLDQALLTIPAAGAANRFAVRVVAAISVSVAIVVALGLRIAGDPPAAFTLWCCIALPAIAIAQFVSGALRARGAMTTAAAADGIVQPLGALMLAVAAAVWYPSLSGFALAFLLSWIVTLLFALRVDWTGPAIGKDTSSHLLRTGRSMLGVAFLQQAASSADVLMLGLFVSAAEVGRYAAAQKIAAAFILLHGAVTTAVTPFMRALAGTRSLLVEYHQIVTRWIFAAALPLFVVTAGAPALVLRLFGRAYVRGNEPALVILSIAAVVLVLSGPAGSALLCSGNARTLFRVSAFGTVCMIAAVTLSAPYGVAAVALGVLVGRILARGSLMLALRRLIGAPASGAPLLVMIGGGAGGAAVARVTAGPFGSIPAAALGCAIALGVAAVVMTRQGDIAFLRSEIGRG